MLYYSNIIRIDVNDNLYFNLSCPGGFYLAFRAWAQVFFLAAGTGLAPVDDAGALPPPKNRNFTNPWVAAGTMNSQTHFGMLPVAPPILWCAAIYNSATRALYVSYHSHVIGLAEANNPRDLWPLGLWISDSQERSGFPNRQILPIPICHKTKQFLSFRTNTPSPQKPNIFTIVTNENQPRGTCNHPSSTSFPFCHII